MKHHYSKILIAIAEGKEIQWLNELGEWVTVSAANALSCIVTQATPDLSRLRIKPATIFINGVECTPPIDNGKYCVSITKHGFPATECVALAWATQEARDAAYAALIKPFGEQV